jgi:hypothetical protein
MKLSFLLASLILMSGIGLLIVGASDSAEVTLLGMTFQPHTAKGAGIIAIIFSLITFLIAWGSSLKPSQVERRK